ncbi:MAG: hypothetical protein JWL83_3015, partial [Actinomycetia bacterium]|nr:hypothetical protein [Actinomycetes bacterium]
MAWQGTGAGGGAYSRGGVLNVERYFASVIRLVRGGIALLCTAALFGAGLVALSAAPASADSSSISGTVTAAAGGGPLSGVCVNAFTPGTLTLVAQATTDATGAYTLATVPTGNVDMQFIGSGLCPGGVGVNVVTQWFNNQPTQASATPVTVVTGSPTLNVDAAMVAGGSISGTVTAAAGGAGLSGICVGAFVPAVDAVLVASTST